MPEHNGLWIMHEYSIPNQNSLWVLCRLRKKDRAVGSIEVEAKEGKKRNKKSSTKRKRNQTKDLDAPLEKRNKSETEITRHSQETFYLSICSQPEAIPALDTVE